MRIKICGITNLEDALVCVDNGADALGFIFYEMSPRFILPEAAFEIIQKIPPFIFKVGVFVDEKIENVNSIARQTGLNAVQLHGNEAPDYNENIFPPVIKSFRVNENFNWSLIGRYKNCGILLDTYSPQAMGGTGKSFNWDFIPGGIRNKIILSGGISINNLERVLNEVNPAAIDVSSSLELMPGKKDHQKIKSFMKKFNNLKGIDSNR